MRGPVPGGPAPGPAVEAEGLVRRFGPVTAVDGLTFRVEPGELFGIVGPDGAGKTTVLRILAGVLRPSGGRVRVLGTDVARDPEAVKPRIAYMSQTFGLYRDLTVRENIEFYADLYRVPGPERPARLDRLFAFSGLGPFQDRLAGDLSGGMQQKLGLCCALIHRPELLLLDEPTFGVDPVSRRDLWLILHGMVAGGVTAVVATSYLDEAERCDRVALVEGGRLLALDRPAGLLDRLPGTVIAVSTPEPRRARDALRAAPGVRDAVLFGDTVHALVEAGDPGPAALRARLREAGIPVEAVEAAEPSLEDVFVHLVKEEAGA